MHYNLLKKPILRDTKLLVWEGGINFSFAQEENVKGIFNNFLNWFKFASDRINIYISKKQVFRMLRFCFVYERKNEIFKIYMNFTFYLSKYLEISYSKIWNLIQFQDYLYQKRHFLGKFYVKVAYLEQE